jgi:hypothetical protein
MDMRTLDLELNDDNSRVVKGVMKPAINLSVPNLWSIMYTWLRRT